MRLLIEGTFLSESVYMAYYEIYFIENDIYVYIYIYQTPADWNFLRYKYLFI